jgi:hypothetical protein
MEKITDLVKGIPYEDIGSAIAIVRRGADKALLYFWFNLKSGNYNWMPEELVLTDVKRMVLTYPTWRNEIEMWYTKYIVNGTKKIRSHHSNYTRPTG